ncbi:MAG: hypothetical protein QOG35_2401, partial [Solirubrobacteraceae bacterium]|nr:hypothetical protein [Solirubrobacteraceae bacterium]
MSSGNWSTQQLAEFLAVVSAVPEPAAAVREAVERAAEALEAEVGAVVQDGAVTASVGFPAGAVPEDDLLALALAAADAADLPGLGPCRIAVAPLEGAESGSILLARLGDVPFDRPEISLVRGMARVLALTLRMLHLLEDERGLREESERQAADNARLLASLEERRALHAQIARLQETMSHRTPLQEVLDAIVGGAGDLLGEEMVALRLVDANDTGQTVTVAWRGMSDETIASGKRTPVEQGLGGRAIVEGGLVVARDYGAEAKPMPGPIVSEIRSAVAVPVHEHGTVAGSLTVASGDPTREFSQPECELLLAYARQAGLALAAARTVDTMRHAFNDSLTGLANRALFLDRLEQALVRAQRGRGSVTVLYLDVDRFKLVNDSLGHVTGDALLVAVADRIKRGVRGAETVARLGGDEFAVLLEDASQNDAVRVADRIRDALAAPLQVDDRDVTVTASIGIASGNGTADELVRDAD